MKSDIQIAQEAKTAHISEIAARAGIPESATELYGSNKAKYRFPPRECRQSEGKLILVTAIPDPRGEGRPPRQSGCGRAAAAR